MTPRQQMGMLFLGALALMLVFFFVQRAAINEAFVDAGRCGSNLGVCPGWPGTSSRCMNGYCKSDVQPELPAVSDLPIRPDRYTDPTPLLQQKAGL